MYPTCTGSPDLKAACRDDAPSPPTGIDSWLGKLSTGTTAFMHNVKRAFVEFIGYTSFTLSYCRGFPSTRHRPIAYIAA